MSKSKYPNQIDTSIELPIARDNITQVTSELFNSLKYIFRNTIVNTKAKKNVLDFMFKLKLRIFSRGG